MLTHACVPPFYTHIHMHKTPVHPTLFLQRFDALDGMYEQVVKQTINDKDGALRAAAAKDAQLHDAKAALLELEAEVQRLTTAEATWRSRHEQAMRQVSQQACV